MGPGEAPQAGRVEGGQGPREAQVSGQGIRGKAHARKTSTAPVTGSIMELIQERRNRRES